MNPPDCEKRLNVPHGLTRSAWSDHPHYPEQLLLLGSHDNFRRASRSLIEWAGRLLRDADAVAMAHNRDVFNQWQAAMGGHEHYEEHKLYPYLERRYGVELGRLRHGHQRLSRLRADVRSAYGSYRPDEQLGALQSFDAELRAHLAEEEDAVIPLLLHLPRADFVSYSRAQTAQPCSDVVCAC